jgi:hypothetical protein
VIGNGYHLKSSGERGWRETREESAKKFAKKGTKSTSVPQEKEEQTSKTLKYVIRIERTMSKEQRIYKRKHRSKKENLKS